MEYYPTSIKKRHTIRLAQCRLIILFSIVLTTTGFIRPIAHTSPLAEQTFHSRKQAWIARSGSDLGGGFETRAHLGRSYIFAWLEQGFTTDPTESGLGTITDVIHGTGPYNEGLIEHDNAAGTTAGLNLLRIILQYDSVLDPADSQAIHNMFRSKTTHDYGIVSRMGAVGSSHSTQPQRSTEAFLYASIFEPGAVFTLERYDNWTASCPGCSGTSYRVGNSYSTKEFTRDLLLNGMHNWVTAGNGEFDGNYTHLLVESMLLLYDFSPDPDLKNRARMVLDFMLLEQAMDFAFGQNAGAQGRSYRANILRNIYIDKGLYPLLGIGSDRYGSISGSFYVTSYQPPELLRSLVSIDDRPDAYWRLHMENNSIANLDGSTGKWTFATPNFTLGMAESGTPRWQVTIRANSGSVFKLWIDDHANSGDPGYPDDEWSLGTGTAIHYRSSLHIRRPDGHLHVVRSSGTFDEGEENLVPHVSGSFNDYSLAHSGWNFFRKGKTALALYMDPEFAALELAAIGVDYPDFNSFRSAVETNSSASRNSFTNSRGEMLSHEVQGGSINSQPIHNFPYPRMKTTSSAGNLISWNSSIMTVTHNGAACRYDFSQWKTWGSGCSEELPQPVFDDVPFSHPYHDEIHYLYQHGYTAGCSTSPKLYCPDHILNRAESAVFMMRGSRGAAFDPPNPVEQVFSDVVPGEWYFRWVDALYNEGLTAGCGTAPLIYCPGQEHTLAEASVFNLRILYGEDYIPEPAEGIFSDAPVTAWYTKYLESAYRAGLIEPCAASPELKICPEQPLTRALEARILYLALTIPSE